MTTYNTGNALGSVDVRDLYDNAENLDDFSNGPLNFYTDRLGVSRQSLQGIRNASSYQNIGAYGAGLVFTSYNQTFTYLGDFYAPSAGLTLPYTTTGAGAGEISSFRNVSDAVLRSDLAASGGAGLIGLSGTVADRSVQTALESVRHVADFGAVGDGVTNDTPALHLAFAWLQDSPGRTIELGAGLTYLQGPGTTAFLYEAATYFPARFDFESQNNMTIQGNGAIIMASVSLTDTPLNRGFHFLSCNDLSVSDLTYEGSLADRTPFGADFFNGNNELTGNRKSGFGLMNCYSAVFTRVNSNRTMMDGFTLFRTSSLIPDSQSRDCLFLYCDGYENYRQGVSIVGGDNNTFIGGKFNDTGTVKGTLPMAGIDVESDFDSFPCIGNVFIGVEFSGNLTGIFFSTAAQDSLALNCRVIGSRAYGVGFTNSGICRNNTFSGGIITQEDQSVQAEKYAVYMGGKNNKVIGTVITASKPNRGITMLNFSNTESCLIDGVVCNDTTPVSDGSFSQILCNIPADTVNCVVQNSKFREAVGTNWSVLVGSPTATFINNSVTSSWGESGARGCNVTAADRVVGNTGFGTKVASTPDSAVFNISGAATLVREMGPNVDRINPRVGGQVRRVGFVADVIKFSTLLDLPSLAAGGVNQQTFAVDGATLGDIVAVTLTSPSNLLLSGVVSAPGSVLCSFFNPTASAIDRPNSTLRIQVTAS